MYVRVFGRESESNPKFGGYMCDWGGSKGVKSGCMHVCMYVDVCVCMCTLLCAYVCVYAYVSVGVCA